MRMPAGHLSLNTSCKQLYGLNDRTGCHSRFKSYCQARWIRLKLGIYKRERSENYRKIRPIPHPLRALSRFHISYMQLLAIRFLIAIAHSSVSGPFFYYMQLLATAQRTNLEDVANGEMNF